MTPRFEKAYNALVKAFFEGTLAKGDCSACAVGNIVADAQGGCIDFFLGQAYCNTDNWFWSKLFMTIGGNQVINHPFYDQEKGLALTIETLTGYTYLEMAKVEKAFEQNTHIDIEDYSKYTFLDILEDQYRGLCAVVDVMLKLDGIEPDPKYAAKFREHKSLQPA